MNFPSECHNCNHVMTDLASTPWSWSIWDKKTEGLEFSIITDEANESLFSDENDWTEVYFCPKCLAMQ